MRPSYIELYESGELAQRVARLEARLRSCDICPRDCRINRLDYECGYCHTGRLPVISSFCAHRGEEPAISGNRGSGTIFFGNCNMRCVYCQNYQISQDHRAQESNAVDTLSLARTMLYLQNTIGCHNINLVSPSHVVPQIARAVLEAVPLGLKIPFVYNTGGYDSLEIIRELDGIVDIYLPDLRYSSNESALKYSGAPDYVEHARAAIKEMYRQVGELVIDESGVAQRGLIVRLLILPNRLAGVRESLQWLASELSPTVTLSVMAQYYPTHRAPQIPLLSRKITELEYYEIVDRLDELKMGNGWLQQLDSSDSYRPDFHRDGHPFEPAGQPD